MLDLLYGHMAGARRRWYERHPEARRQLRQPVISVGNLSVGGTGKTPLVRQIAEWLSQRGERPAILSRGYRRSLASPGVTVVSDGATVFADVETAGDEPLMLARQLPGVIVCVCEERHVAGALAERVLGATVHILDDGFQHVQLARECDILVTSPGEITGGRVLPFGRLREPHAAAGRAQFVVVVGADTDAARTEAWELGVGAYSAARRGLGALGAPGALGALGASGASRASGALGALGGGVVAVAGIGAPDQFFSMLRDSGAELKKTIAFPDHHRYTAADVARIESAVNSTGAHMVVTTEKDVVRFERMTNLPFALTAMPMRLELEDAHALTALLEHVLARRGRAA